MKVLIMFQASSDYALRFVSTKFAATDNKTFKSSSSDQNGYLLPKRVYRNRQENVQKTFKKAKSQDPINCEERTSLSKASNNYRYHSSPELVSFVSFMWFEFPLYVDRVRKNEAKIIQSREITKSLTATA